MPSKHALTSPSSCLSPIYSTLKKKLFIWRDLAKSSLQWAGLVAPPHVWSPQTRLEPMSPVLAGIFVTTGPPGKSSNKTFFISRQWGETRKNLEHFKARFTMFCIFQRWLLQVGNIREGWGKSGQCYTPDAFRAFGPVSDTEEACSDEIDIITPSPNLPTSRVGSEKTPPWPHRPT